MKEARVKCRKVRSPPQEEERVKISPLHDCIRVARVAEQELGRADTLIPDSVPSPPRGAPARALQGGRRWRRARKRDAK